MVNYSRIYGRKFLHWLASKFSCDYVAFSGFNKRFDFKRILKVRSERESLLTPLEAYQLVACVRAVKNIPGDMAEVGVYQGASAKLILDSATCNYVLLFDTYSGLPEAEDVDYACDIGRFNLGLFKCTMKEVKKYIGEYEQAVFVKGCIQEKAHSFSDYKFSFIHLDCDLYSATKFSLEFFYPRLSAGGMILVHDACSAAGVVAALNAFIGIKWDRPPMLLELPGDQMLVIKV